MADLAELEKAVEDALLAASRVVEAQGPVAAVSAAWAAFRDEVRAPAEPELVPPPPA